MSRLMKKISQLLLMPLLCTTVHAQEQIKVMSYNFRLDVESDRENRWDARKEKVAALLNYYGADFIGNQEVQHHQLQYLSGQLKRYNHIGVSRDDGKEAGGHSCIFYNKEKFEPVQQSTFWLSPTPDSVSMGWDAACKRVCTYGLFKSKKTKQLLWVLNTYIDHMGVTARTESAKLIVEKINQLNKEKNYPVVLTGNFNSKPDGFPVMHVSKVLQNSRAISQEPPYEPLDTWTAFQFTKKTDGRIDYIFVSNGNKWAVKKFATITDSYNMKYPSDHFPVFATLELKK